MVHEALGFDAFKATKGRKRFTVVDTLGLVMMVLVTAASVPEREGGKQVLQRLFDLGDTVRRLYLIWVDGGYSGFPFLKWVMDCFRWIVQVVLRPQQNRGFVVVKSGGLENERSAGDNGLDDSIRIMRCCQPLQKP
jgi:putative transposase